MLTLAHQDAHLAQLVPPAEAGRYRRHEPEGWLVAPGEPTPPKAPRSTPPTRVELLSDLRSLLARFLNLEWPTRSGSLLYPFSRSLNGACRGEAQALLHRRGLSQTVGTIDDLARILADGYESASRLSGPHPLPSQRHLEIPALNRDARTLAEPGFSRLRDALRKLQVEQNVRCILHGSLATGDWTAYRDADLLVLIPQATCRSWAALQALRRALVPVLAAVWDFDPLQHHGVFVLPDIELDTYPEHMLPVAALEFAVDPCSRGFLFHCRPSLDTDSALRDLYWAVQRLRTTWIRGLPFADAYDLKAFTSVLMLVPSLYLAAVGRPAYKRDSFGEVSSLLPRAFGEPQEQAARLRSAWPRSRDGWLSTAAKLLRNPRARVLATRRSRRVPAELLPADVRDWQWNAHVQATLLYRLAQAEGAAR